MDMPQNGAINLGEMMKGMFGRPAQKRKMLVPDARKALESARRPTGCWIPRR